MTMEEYKKMNSSKDWTNLDAYLNKTRLMHYFQNMTATTQVT